MEHTIAQGDKYCSRVLHDTRIDYDLPQKFIFLDRQAKREHGSMAAVAGVSWAVADRGR